MKIHKALKKPSTGEYWVWNSEISSWCTSLSPDLLKETATIDLLRAFDILPPDESDMELVELVILEKSEYEKQIKK